MYQMRSHVQAEVNKSREAERDRIFGSANEMTSFLGTTKIESILRHTLEALHYS